MNRLKQLRLEKGLTLDNIQKETKINRGTYNNYENGTTKPSSKTWQALADYFGVSVPYLQGAYSKEEIAKIVQSAYKANYYNKPYKNIDRGHLAVFSMDCDDFFVALGIVPYDIKKEDKLLNKSQVDDFELWLKKLDELYFVGIAMRWLISKPEINADSRDVLDAVLGALNSYVKDNKNYLKRLTFEWIHSFITKDGKEYYDWDREHPNKNKFYF